jgi:hypothetical protein
MTLVVNQMIAISALVHVALARGSLPRHYIAKMSIHQNLHVRRNLSASEGPQHEMKMIRHQAERNEAYDGPFRGICHRGDKPEVVRGGQEDARLAVPAVDDVLRDEVGVNARRSGHDRTAPPRILPTCQGNPTPAAGT